MAAAGPVISEPRIVGALVPGDGLVRFCSTFLNELHAGDWVVVDGPLGEEPGEVRFTAERVAALSPIIAPFSIPRRLSSTEVERAMRQLTRAAMLVDVARDIVSQLVPAAEISSLRFNLDGSTLLLRVHAGAGDHAASLSEALAGATGIPVVVEWTEASPRAYGSLGRIGSAAGERELVLDRLQIDEVQPGQFPHGWPRLGQRVRTPQGIGHLHSILVRHNVATVRLESGEEFELPVEELSWVEG